MGCIPESGIPDGRPYEDLWSYERVYALDATPPLGAEEIELLGNER